MKIFFLIISLVVLFTPSSSMSLEYTIGRSGKSLSTCVTSDPKSFNPILAQEVSTTDITQLIFAPLLEIDPETFDILPGLIESWEMIENGRIWLVHFRKDLTWSDGNPITSDDLLYTFNSVYDNPKNNLQSFIHIYDKPVILVKIDQFTIRFELSGVFADFPTYLSNLRMMPKHILDRPPYRDQFEKAYSTKTPIKEIIGSGPFTIKEYKPGKLLTFVRNPRYYRKDEAGNKLPYLDRVDYFITQQDLALLKFQSNEIDIFGLRAGDIRGRTYDVLKQSESGSNYRLFNVGASFGSFFIVLNQNVDLLASKDIPANFKLKLTWFRNLEFRKAIAHLIDKNRIIEQVMNDLALPQHGPLSPSNKKYYTDKVLTYDYNPKKAQGILKAAGFVYSDKDKKLRDPQGNIVEFDLFTSSHRQDNIKICAIIREDLQKIGIQIDFSPKNFNEIVNKLTKTYLFDSVLVGLTGSRDPYSSRQVWLSSGNLHMWHPLQKKPATAWEKEIDEIFTKVMAEVDETKKNELYYRWQYLISEQLPMIFTVMPTFIAASRKTIGNFYPLATPFSNSLHNIERIYILDKKEENKVKK